jgi:thiol-disulfide isomerase/thioredoxin
MLARRRPPLAHALVALTFAVLPVLVSATTVAADLGSVGAGGVPSATHAWLGVAMDRAPGAAGVRLTHVLRGSPAEKAGLKEGDLIRAIDGEKVASAEDVSRIVSSHAGGDSIVASVSRAQDPLSIKILLAPRPSADEMLRMDRVGVFAPAWVGVEPVGDAPPSLSSLRGKVVLLDFWATWCGPCRLLAPKLSALQTRYGAQGLRVVGVTTDPAETAALFAQRVNMRYPIAVDRKAETSRAYDVSALPTLFIIDKRGVVRDVAVGYDEGREAQIESLLKELLAEAPPADLAAPAASARASGRGDHP